MSDFGDVEFFDNLEELSSSSGILLLQTENTMLRLLLLTSTNLKQVTIR